MFRRIIALLTVMLGVAVLASAADFSADMIVTAKGGKSEAKIYSAKDKMRMEMKDGMAVMITRLDKKVAWNLMPQQKAYLEMPLKQENRPKIEEKVEGEVERKEVGTETIDGRKTVKYLVTMTGPRGKEQMYQWMAKDIHMGVRSAAVDGSWMQEFRNIKTGPQPESLFEIPAGYTKMTMPGGMSGNMPGGASGNMPGGMSGAMPKGVKAPGM